MKNLINSTMESSILHELAAFDIRAPIDFSISFEDGTEGNDVTIKTEDDDDTKSQNLNDFSVNLLSPKFEIEEEPSETTEKISNSDKVNSDHHSEQICSTEITTHQAEILQNTKKNCYNERKRKEGRLQINKNKRSKKELTQENVQNHLSGYDKENENLIFNSHFAPQDVDTSQINPIDAASSVACGLRSTINENELKEIKTVILSHLAVVSENMRLVMEAYAYHRQYNTPYDSYKKLKFNYFNESYNAIIKIIIPKEQNRAFIFSFLHYTEQRALKNPGLNKCGFHEYEILLKELINWSKDKQKHLTTSKQANTAQPTLTDANCRQGLDLENSRNKTEYSGSSNATKPDTICIFSAGPPGNEISINVDPNLNKCMSASNNFKTPSIEASTAQSPEKSSVDLPRTQMPSQTQLGTQDNNKNTYLQELLRQPPLIPKLAPWIPNNPNPLYPEMYKAMRTIDSSVKGNPTKNNNLPNQINQILPQVQRPTDTQKGQTMLGQSRNPQPQLMPSPRMLPQTQPLINAAHRQQTHAPSPCIQSTRLPPPPYDSRIWNQTWQQQAPLQIASFQHMQSNYNPPNHMQQFGQPQQCVLPQCNSQYGQNQQVQNNKKQSQKMQPQFGQFHPGQNNMGQLQNMQPQYRQFQPVQIETGQLQSMQPQYGQLPTRQSQQSALPQHMPQQVPQHMPQRVPQHMPQHVSPQIGQPSPVPLGCEKRLEVEEWRQGSMDHYHHQGQTEHPDKNTPRSNSTDSGFFSPLNFNTSSDQTLRPVPSDPEPPQILITHVTSLNPEVPYVVEGNCVICKKATKKVCMGCMKIYYCTYDCQVRDWTTHQLDCYNQAALTAMMRETNNGQLQP